MEENLIPTSMYKVSKGGKTASGFRVSLPTIWINYNNIKAGDNILMLQSPQSSDLILRIAKPITDEPGVMDDSKDKTINKAGQQSDNDWPR